MKKILITLLITLISSPFAYAMQKEDKPTINNHEKKKIYKKKIIIVRRLAGCLFEEVEKDIYSNKPFENDKNKHDSSFFKHPHVN